MADPVITVPLELDTKDVDAGLDKVKSNATKAGRDSVRNFKSSFSGDIFSGLSRQLLGLGAAVASGLSFKKSIEAAIVQQNAVNNLNRALAQAGEFSRATSLEFQRFASSLQNVTTFGDEVIIDQLAIAKSFGLTNQQAQKLVQGATELSAVFGTSLESNVKNLGKTFSGLTGELGESLPLIRSLTAEQLKSGQAIDLVLSRFGGAATSQLNTFEGQIKRTTNAFGDFLESSGAAFTSSPQLIAVIKTIGDEFARLAVNANNADINSILKADNIIAFGTAINEFVIAPLELVFNAARVVFNGVNTIVAGSVALIGQKVGFIADLLNKVGVDNGFTQAFQNFRESSAEVFEGVALDTQSSVDNLFNGTVFGKGEQFLENLRVNLEQAKGAIEDSGIKNAIQPSQETGGGDFLTSFTAGFSQAEITLQNFAEKTKAFGQQIRANLQAGIANGAGQAFAAFGQALATGQDALGAFAKAFIGSIGQIAIQQGAAFILQGIAYQFVPGFQATGAGLITAGAALAAFGGALSAFSGAGGGATGAGAGAGGGSSIGGQSIIDPRSGIAAPQERLEPSTAVTVNIQGDVFDSEETGLRISNILRDASLNQNVRASVFA